MADAFALEAVALCKRFGSRRALEDVHLTVRPGDVQALIGPNGAGKTTLLRILLGLLRPDSGTVVVLGRERRATGGGLPDSVAGFVETPSFYPYLSARANLALLARLDGGGDRSIDVARALEDVGLSPSADMKVRTYSAGMRQRLGIAAAWLRRPALLLLDEPASALDPTAALELRRHLAGLAERGAAVLLATHDLAEVEAACNSVTILDGGRVRFTGSLTDLHARMPRRLHVLRTSDDEAAAGLARLHAGVMAAASSHGGLEIEADGPALDAYVIALARDGIAVRSLVERTASLERLVARVTATEGTAA